MKIAVIFFFSSLLFSLNGLSSNLIKFHNKVDSINAIINQTEDDTLKARAYLDLSEILYQSDLDTVIVLCETSIDIINNNLSQELSQQERGQYFEPSDMHKHHWCAVTLGKIDFIITSKNIEL